MKKLTFVDPMEDDRVQMKQVAVEKLQVCAVVTGLFDNGFFLLMPRRLG